MDNRYVHAFFAFLFIGLLAPSLAFAQSGSVEGTVYDGEAGEALPGATVLLEEPNIGAATDANGNYTLDNVPEGTHTLQVSFVGFLTHEEEIEVAANQSLTVDVELEPDVAGLEEVVVEGLGIRQTRERAQVSVSRVDAEDLTEQASFQGVSQLVQGNIAGVNVQEASGNVGGGMRFNVRAGGGLGGDGQPVIYVDGTRIDNAEVEGFGAGGQGISALADLNPNDIASIDVIRGAAGAAIYGTDGANGVVLITTRSGDAGADPTFNVNYRGTFGANDQPRLYDENLYEQADLANSWFRTGALQGHYLGVSGGQSDFNYYASVDNRFEEGHLPNNEGNRTNVRANFEAFPNDDVTVRANAGFTVNKLQRPDNDNNIQGSLGESLLGPFPYANTDSVAIRAIEDVQRVNRFVGSLSGTYTPIQNLTLSGTVGYDASTRRQDRTRPVGFFYSGIQENGDRNIYNRLNNQLNADVQAQYTYDITAAIEATSLIGGQFTDVSNRVNSGTSQDLASGLVTGAGTGADILSFSESFTNERTGGIFAQQEFVIDNTYTLTGMLRRDVATALGEGVTDVYYPSVSASVRLDQFDFVPEDITLLQPRVAYGAGGNLPGVVDGQFIRYGVLNSGYGGSAVIDNLGNPDLVPERVEEVEVGFDLEYQDRVSFDATYFNTFANNSIIDVQLAPSTGFGFSGLAQPRNVGGIKSQGVELSLGLVPVVSEDAQVDLNLTYGYQSSEVTDIGDSAPIFDGFDLNVITPGLPRAAFYTHDVQGAVLDESGAYAGVDVSEDREYLGQPLPVHTGGLRLNATLFGSLTLSGQAEFALGHQVFNNTHLFAALTGVSAERNELIGELETLEPGTDEYTETAHAVARTDPNYDGNYIEDGDYLKIREIAARYDVSGLLETAGVTNIESLSVGVAARNLATFTSYSGPDPEVNFDGSRSLSRGQEFLTLPTPRQVYFTVSVGL